MKFIEKSGERTPAQALADSIEPLLKEYTAKVIGDAFGMVMYRMGYKAAMEARIVTILDNLNEEEDDEEIALEEVEPSIAKPPKQSKPN